MPHILSQKIRSWFIATNSAESVWIIASIEFKFPPTCHVKPCLVGRSVDSVGP